MEQTITASLLRLEAGARAAGPGGPGAALVEAGRLGAEGAAAGPGAGLFLPAGCTLEAEARTEALVFCLGAPPPGAELLASERAALPGPPWLLRLDEVSFPPGAVAWRHVHPGPGFRVLRRGALRLEADGHGFEAAPGTAWFEPAGSPVRATASPDHPETRFVRFMVLPPSFRGRPTIRILDPAEAALPKRQSTLRHIDEIVAQAPQDAGS